MENTLKMFKSLDSKSLYKYTYEELCLQYKSNQNPQILANVFIRVYDLINKCASKFFIFSSNDVSSISVTTLDYCLQNFDNDYSAKFTTYYYSILYKKFNTELKSQYYNKRKANTIWNINIFPDTSSFCPKDDCDSIFEVVGADESIYDSSKDFETNLITYMTINNSTQLSDKEKQCCNYIMNSGHKCFKSEIAEALNISRPTLYSIFDSLNKKLKIILN